MLKNAIKNIGKFYDIDLMNNSHSDEIFEILGEILKFDCAGIFYLTPNSFDLEYSKDFPTNEKININSEISKIFYDTSTEDIQKETKEIFKLSTPFLVSRLTIKEAVIGIIVITRTQPDFNSDEKIIFESCSKIISNIIKDLEISQVLKLQVKAMEEGLVETHRAYETIKKQNKKIKQNEKLQNEFIASISHDLRTPLNSIITTTELLNTKFFGELNPKQQDYVNDIRIAGLKLLGMINEILDIAKINSHTIKLNLSKFKLSDAIFEVCNIIKPLAVQKDLKIIETLDDKIELTADYIKIQQILLNILSNAIKYASSKIEIQTYQKKKKVFISIKDDGIGIDKQYHKKIFDKFYQVQNNLLKTEPSTGLGLTIAKEFVKLHSGKITVISSDNKGTEFVVEL